jgi:flagellar hook-basal body complex protein FliE
MPPTPLGSIAGPLSLSSLPAETALPPRAATGAPGFQDWLVRSLEQTSEMERHSQTAIAGLLTGDDLTQAEVFTAVRQADLAFRTMLQIRNKLLEAYNELKNLRM